MPPYPNPSQRDGGPRRMTTNQPWARRTASAVLFLALAGGGALGTGAAAWALPSASTTTPTPTSTTPAPTTTTPAPTSTTTPPTSGGTTTTPTPAPAPKPWAPTWRTTLRPGMKGTAVKAAQKRLQQLGYWVGKADGHYGTLTAQAVLAVQKSHRMKRTGVLDAATRKAITVGLRPKARTTSGSAIEVDLKRQIVLVVSKGRTRWVLNTSTGNGKIYYQAGRREVAVTPKGRFRIQRQIDGLRVSALGELWRPKYFYRGYALHGSPSIPAYPASHGCVRLSNSAMNWLWSSGHAPIGRKVWIY